MVVGILNPHGQPINGGGPGRINLRQSPSRHGQRKCGPDVPCDGLRALVTMTEGAGGNRVTVAGEPGQLPEAVGFFSESSRDMFVFSFCPFCGARLKLAANRG